MFAGHAALALVAKKQTPDLSLGALVAASFGIDLIWPLLLLTGIERVRVDPGNTAFTPLDFESYPWTHSLLLVLVWAGLAGAAAYLVTRSRRSSLIISVLVLSHWILDLLTHRPDLPIWPGESSPMGGLGLWNSIPGTLAVEGSLFIFGAWLYVRSTRAKNRIGSLSLAAFLGLIFFIWASGPFAPPPPDAGAVAVVALAIWLLPPWAGWFDRHRESAT